MTGVIVFALFAVTIVWLFFYMRMQKGDASVLQLLQQQRYADAVAEADRVMKEPLTPGDSTALHRAEALKLLGNFVEAERAYRDVIRQTPDDAAAIEGLALSITHQRGCEEARTLMSRAIQSFPQIQEFQAIVLAFIELNCGREEEAMRIFEDNRLLVATRFRDDYTDPDPLLAETMFIYGILLERSGNSAEARRCFAKVEQWAPGSIFAEWSAQR